MRSPTAGVKVMTRSLRAFSGDGTSSAPTPLMIESGVAGRNATGLARCTTGRLPSLGGDNGRATSGKSRADVDAAYCFSDDIASGKLVPASIILPSGRNSGLLSFALVPP